MRIKLCGNWQEGWAFDVHIRSSTFVGTDEFGHDQFDNERSEMGELVYQLKYSQKQENVAAIVQLLDQINEIGEADLILPIPATDNTRRFQPVRLIAEALGKRRGVKVITGLLSKTSGGPQLKNVTDPAERKKLLREKMSLSDGHRLTGLKVLLVDDLYRSGSTLSVATELILSHNPEWVRVLTMTKTKSKR